MRQVDYLSPSAIGVWLENPDLYYLRYLADNKPERDAQTEPMAIGSAFDAYVKAYLYERLFGTKEGKYELRTLFETQVDKRLWDWAWSHGKYVFEQYKQSGALVDLMLLLQQSPSEPRFEFEVRGVVNGYREGIEGQFGEVVLLGKPDVHFVTKEGQSCILDWKVNGYCAKNAKSPNPYYLRLRAAGGVNHGRHSWCSPVKFDDMMVNVTCGLEEIDESWARQLAIYGWLCGESIGTKFITVIHQIVCGPNPGGLPKIRIAEHHNFISPAFQQKVFDLACDLWQRTQSGHYFAELSREESDKRCALLEAPPLIETNVDAWIAGMR